MSENPKFEEQKNRLIHHLATMFDYLGLSGSFKVESKPQKIMVKISSDDAGRIIGRKGQTLESLQLVLNRLMFKEDEECPRISLDIDGYSNGERESRERREQGGERRERSSRRERGRRDDRRGGGDRIAPEELEQLARDKAKEVKRWGDPVKMPEMNAHDRRIVHMALQDDPEVTTESEGEGAFKKVVISLRKEEAAPVAETSAE